MGERADIQDGQQGPSDGDGPTLLRRIQELKEAIEYQSQMGMTDLRAKQLTASHIAALDKYNTCKEHTQSLMKAIASVEGKTLTEVFERFGLDSSD
ncbi:hypothetical protein PGT21_028399 [Puccinia graminis f. sp. tritici]|uniref:DNA repair protein SWI5 homolog n=1 Tax=Puccinia graminis f. sp. tritici TaxID=56615 RepID=A0A5B0RRB5_PUCGR|nr:hypothetical protein PGT21_028399 [Puccinia graminis f. sp. tritici]KAA1128360.1 hypothetical protein PGTUg99_013967 [Puccinia graminis f. sp. tritici]